MWLCYAVVDESKIVRDRTQIVNDALELHRTQIKTKRGVPGVTEEKLAEGLDVRHCALSLVGEPIMYPKING